MPFCWGRIIGKGARRSDVLTGNNTTESLVEINKITGCFFWTWVSFLEFGGYWTQLAVGVRETWVEALTAACAASGDLWAWIQMLQNSHSRRPLSHSPLLD